MGPCSWGAASSQPLPQHPSLHQMLSAGPVPLGRAALWLRLQSAGLERLGNANVALSERVQLLPSLSALPGTRAGSGPPRVPQAASGSTEFILPATIIISHDTSGFPICNAL